MNTNGRQILHEWKQYQVNDDDNDDDDQWVDRP